jgi:glyoxylase-like metal-dependent hydrolase (beta-lactamase superfamily II)
MPRPGSTAQNKSSLPPVLLKKAIFFILNFLQQEYTMVKQIVVGALQTNCYIYSSDSNPTGKCIIIDPGGDGGTIISHIDELELSPIGVALTHGHFDHTSALGSLVEYFKRTQIALKVAIHERDKKYLGKSSAEHHKRDFRNLGIAYSDEMAGTLPDLLPPADVIISEGDRVLGSDLVVIDTPGHTEGGICFYSSVEGVLFSGDTLFYEGIGRSDIPGGNEFLLIKNIKEKLLVLPPETNVYPGHGPVTTIGREAQTNPFLNM